MTANEAARILTEKYNEKSIIECLDFADFYAFAIVDKGKEKEEFAGGYYTVNKKTSSISTFNPTDDLDAYLKAKIIDIDTLK